MNTKIIEFMEMTPNEGYLLTDGEIYTTYVCTLNEEDKTSVWSEIAIDDVPTDKLPYEFQKDNEMESESQKGIGDPNVIELITK